MSDGTTEDSDLDCIVSEILALLVSGASVDLESHIALHPELAQTIRGELSQLCRALSALGRSPPVETPMPPIVGDYELGWRVGLGGEGAAVYRAMHRETRQVVALKVLPPGSGDRRTSRFRSQQGLQFGHPNLVPVLQVGEDRGFHYLAMEFMVGGSLARVLEALRQESTRDLLLLPRSLLERMGLAIDRIPSNPRERILGREYVQWAVSVACAVADGLEAIHTNHVLHRDVKPANILFDGDATPRLGDLGLARRIDKPELTSPGVALGTRHYMSPEQLEGVRDQVDDRTDVYAVGATLYELLSLSVPFAASSEVRLIDAIRYQRPRGLPCSNPAVGRDLDAVVQKCLEKEPELRFSSAGELARELRRLLGGLRPSTRPVRWTTQLLRKARRRPGVVVAMAGAVVVSMAALGYVVGFRIERRAREMSHVDRQLVHVRTARDAFQERQFVDGYRATWMGIDESLEGLRWLSDQNQIPAFVCNIAEMVWRSDDPGGAGRAKKVLDLLLVRGVSSSMVNRRRFLELRKDVLFATEPSEASGVLRELLALPELEDEARASLMLQGRLLRQLTAEERIEAPGLVDVDSPWATERVPVLMRDGNIALWRLDDPVPERRGRLTQDVVDLLARGNSAATKVPTFLVVAVPGGFHCLLQTYDSLLRFWVPVTGQPREISADKVVLRGQPGQQLDTFCTRLSVLEHDEIGRPRVIYVATTNAATDRSDCVVTFGAEPPVVPIAGAGKSASHTNCVLPLSATGDRLLLGLGEWGGFGMGILERRDERWSMTRLQRIGQVCSLARMRNKHQDDPCYLVGKGSQWSAGTFWRAGGVREWDPGVYLVQWSDGRGPDVCTAVAKDIDIDPNLRWQVLVLSDVQLTGQDLTHVALLQAQPRSSELRVYPARVPEGSARLVPLLRMRTSIPPQSPPAVRRDLDGDGDDEILALGAFWQQDGKVVVTVLGRNREP